MNKTPESNYGTLRITVTPHTAKVLLDERSLEGEEVIYLPKVKVGVYKIRVENPPLYLPEERIVTITRGRTTSISIDLKPNYGSLYISTVPTAAKVSIIELATKAIVKEGITPANIELFPGKYMVSIAKGDMYDGVTDTIHIEGGQEFKLENITLPLKYGELIVSTNPEGARVYLNDHYEGKSPMHLSKIEHGKHKIYIESGEEIHGQPKYLACEDITTIVGGKQSVISEKLAPNFGTLQVVSIPEGVNVTISSKNGKIFSYKKRTPAKIDLLPGRYTITLSKKPIYESMTKDLFIRVGEITKLLDIELQPIQLLRGKFVRIPEGPFIMGSEQGDRDEKPVRQIKLDEYWIEKYEVTIKEYAEFVNSSSYRKPTGMENCNWGKPDRENHPVNCVSWNDAQAYIRWLSNNNKYGLKFRLPTEAEWEKAARGINGLNYPWGKEWDGYKANFSDKNSPAIIRDGSISDGFATTSPVGTYEIGKSYFGVYDLAGNVWEWTNSLYRLYPHDANDGRENVKLSGERVIRGGAWDSVPEYLQSFIRSKRHQNDCFDNVGFRVIVSGEYKGK